MRRTARTSRQAGFTLVELMTVVVIIGIILPVIAAIMIYAYRGANDANSRVQASSQLKQALNSMESDVKLATDFLMVVPSGFTDPYGQVNAGTNGANAWNYKGGGAGQRILITSNLATTARSGSDGRQLVYVNSGNPKYDCAGNMYYQPILSYTTIYFLNNKTLYRRILTNTSLSLCQAQSQLQSCPPYLSSTWNAICKANDEAIATNITKFDIAYYQLNGSQPSTQIDPTFSSNNSTTLEDADYVMITLTATNSSGSTTYMMNQRITKVNQP